MKSRLTRVCLSNGGEHGYEWPIGMAASPLPEKEFLYVFFRGTNLSYWSVPTLSLLYGSIGDRLVIDTVSVGSYKACRGMTCVQWKYWLYLFGGLDPDEETIAKVIEGGGYTDESSHAMRFEISPPMLLVHSDSYKRSPMHSGKGRWSIAVEHNDIIYVLSEFFVSQPMHTFESYNVREDTWYALETPPFHDSLSRYSRYTGCLSYLVKDNKICVSTEQFALAYDVDTKKWEPCYLFEGFGYPQPWPWANCTSEKKPWPWANCTSEETKCGPPFEFQGEVVFYGNDCLIGMLINQGLVVGYRIDSGRVVGKQKLCNLPEISDEYASVGSLVGLGNGYFSVSYTKRVNGSLKLVLVTFKVSRLMEPSNDRFLESNFCSKHDIEMHEVDDRFPPSSFAV